MTIIMAKDVFSLDRLNACRLPSQYTDQTRVKRKPKANMYLTFALTLETGIMTGIELVLYVNVFSLQLSDCLFLLECTLLFGKRVIQG